MTFQWLVANVDEGILRRESGKNAARAWVRGFGEGRLHLDYEYSSGLVFDYSIISPNETGWTVTILRADKAAAYGLDWAFELPDQFPYPTDPYRHCALSDDERNELRDHIEKAAKEDDGCDCPPRSVACTHPVRRYPNTEDGRARYTQDTDGGF